MATLGEKMSKAIYMASKRQTPITSAPRKGKTSLSSKQKKQVRFMINGERELKWHQPQEANVAITSTAVVIGCTDIAQGDTDNTRDGDKLSLAGSIQFKAWLRVNTTADITQALPHIRLVIFQWFPQTASGGASEPTSAMLFNNGPSGAPDVLSFFNHDNRQMYRILYNKNVLLTTQGTTDTNAFNSNMHRLLTANISLLKAKRWIQYSAGSSTIATNQIYFLYFSNLAADAQNASMTWDMKIVFRDS